MQRYLDFKNYTWIKAKRSYMEVYPSYNSLHEWIPLWPVAKINLKTGKQTKRLSTESKKYFRLVTVDHELNLKYCQQISKGFLV